MLAYVFLMIGLKQGCIYTYLMFSFCIGWFFLLCCLKERRKEAERIAREREELRRQQQQLRYEQEKRNSLKRPRDVDHRRDDPYCSENKKLSLDTDARFGHGSDYSRQQNRFNDCDHRERGRFPEFINSVFIF